MATELEVAWAAGLFEGEGSITHTSVPHIRLSLAMTDLDIVERFHRIAGVGSRGGWQGEAPRKYTYQWYVDGDAAVALLTTLLPYLGERRTARAHEILGARDAFLAEVTAPRACEWCRTIFTPTFSPGRTRRYCSSICRSAKHNARVRTQRSA